ncbi:hypothetical protein [Thiorhodococcus minor]|uniref:Uncharacterized protein n=1 Tax=Thiorhodococcus minor TaxID=57489 RepID=A0A6M0K4B0_9GAMM|nr:hypothetical protein [Thiorhodococcus minor]NEV64101.1 hypothetical protein [Thiorhodococcus minor]
MKHAHPALRALAAPQVLPDAATHAQLSHVQAQAKEACFVAISSRCLRRAGGRDPAGALLLPKLAVGSLSMSLRLGEAKRAIRCFNGAMARRLPKTAQAMEDGFRIHRRLHATLEGIPS